jgi:hypothetical protein
MAQEITHRITQIGVLLCYQSMLVSPAGRSYRIGGPVKLSAKIQDFCNRQLSRRSLQSIQLQKASEEGKKA